MTPFVLVKKNTQCGLEPENFTFARQPIYEPPAEIVRPAQTRGSNQPAEPDSSLTVSTPTATPVAITFATPTEVTNRRERDRSNVTSGSSTTPIDDGSTLVEGRAKRKRVAPTRFEDEDFPEASPVKKKPLTVKVTEKTPSTLVTSSSSPQVTPPIKISMKSTTSGGIKTPIIVTTPVVTQPVVKPPPQQPQVTTPKERTEGPATTTTVTITTSSTPIAKTESIQEETTPTITVTTSITTDQSKSGTANGTEAESNKDQVVITTAPPVTTVSQPQLVVKKPITQPKSSILETNLTRQFKP